MKVSIEQDAEFVVHGLAVEPIASPTEAQIQVIKDCTARFHSASSDEIRALLMKGGPCGFQGLSLQEIDALKGRLQAAQMSYSITAKRQVKKVKILGGKADDDWYK